MKSLRKYWPLLVLLLLATLLLSSCGGVKVDPNTGEQVYQKGIFEPIAIPLRAAIVFFHNLLHPWIGATAWGWAIILVAVIIRLLLLPLGIRQMRSMRVAQAKMQALQPELDALKKKYAKEKQKLQEEQMKLYQKHGITQAQMAGCLPTLLQMPILFAFYYALLGLILQDQFKPAPFYFIPDLATPSYSAGLTWLTKDFTLQKLLSPGVWPYLVLPAILAVTQYIMTKMSQTNQPAPTDTDNPAAGMMGQMAILMTGMFVFFSLQVPSGLSLYWVVGNLLAMAQQWYVNQQKEHLPAPALAAAPVSVMTGSKPAPRNGAGDGADEDEEDIEDQAEMMRGGPTPTRRKRRRRR